MLPFMLNQEVHNVVHLPLKVKDDLDCECCPCITLWESSVVVVMGKNWTLKEVKLQRSYCPRASLNHGPKVI